MTNWMCVDLMVSEGRASVVEVGSGPRFFSHRSDVRVRTMLGQHGTVESFESWPTEVGGWNYQLIVARV